MTVNQFFVGDMRSASSAAALEAALRRVAGVEQVVVLTAEKAVRVTHRDEVRVHTLVEAIRRAGYSDVAVLA